MASKKTIQVTITTATKLSATELKDIKSLVEKKVGKATFEQVVDSNLLGGIKISIGSQEFDGSTRTKLESLEPQLPRVTVTTAVALDKKQQKAIQEKLEEKLGSINYSETVDPEVIGGIKITVDSQEYDATLKGKLEKLQNLLLKQV